MTAANFMDAKTFNQNYELDRKAKGVRANAKGAPPEPLETILTADGTAYDASKTYYFFDQSAAEVRASARSVLLIGKNPENEFQKALCQTKNNLAPKYQKSIGFEIKESQFFWTGESGLTAETMLSQLRNDTGEERGEKQDAISFLKTVLSDGERPAKDVQTEARQLGISEKTLQRAKHALNVKSDKKGGNFGGNPQWFWKMETTEDGQNIIEDGQMNKDDHLQSNHSNKTSYRNNLAEDGQDISSDHLQAENDHLQPPKCSKCDSEMQLTEGGKTSFCPLGCSSRKAD
jgi:hypothetical protein